jgi:aromatic ring-cleaving dioxygenase
MLQRGDGRRITRFDVVARPDLLCDNFALETVERNPNGRFPVSENRGYHAHVYYSAETKPAAIKLRETIIGKFAVEPGGFSDEPRGPHPISQFNVIFKNEEFQSIVPWLMLNRDGLDVLVHPLTESSYDDHSKNALWLGTPVPMKLDILRPTYRAELLPKDLQHTA